jgi:hypothetical protein
VPCCPSTLWIRTCQTFPLWGIRKIIACVQGKCTCLGPDGSVGQAQHCRSFSNTCTGSRRWGFQHPKHKCELCVPIKTQFKNDMWKYRSDWDTIATVPDSVRNAVTIFAGGVSIPGIGTWVDGNYCQVKDIIF